MSTRRNRLLPDSPSPLPVPEENGDGDADEYAPSLSSFARIRKVVDLWSWKLWLLITVVVFFCLQTLTVQYSIEDGSALRHLVSSGSGAGAGLGLSGTGGNKRSDVGLNLDPEIAKAFDEWRLLAEKYPTKFLNFSDYLLHIRDKETKLRNRLHKLNQKKVDAYRDMVVPPAEPPPKYPRKEDLELKITYLSDEKLWPYVGSDKYLDMFAKGTRHYYNSLAVFPHNNRKRMHGLGGIWPNGTRAWIPAPMPPPIDEYPGGKEAARKDGGFYLALSKALPVDREVNDTRDKYCFDEKYVIDDYDDVSVIITFYNEHASTLLRSVHSVLNNTPPPLLREILLVDDHSNSTDLLPGGFVYEYVKLLPKVKLMRLPERRGLVQARTAGAKMATAPVFVVLDSHIEVNPVWLEPQLKRLNESPKSVVFPQIMGINTETLTPVTSSGIGCFLSFKWIMQERPYFDASPSAEPVPSASMAGGLFAIRRDWFFESGGYDEEFSMWGAENVEMAFRHWLCGGRVECTPCARTYHIYRNGGSGYKSPSTYIRKNRLRTALVWLDEWWQLARYFIPREDTDIGPLDKMLQLKDRLKCKPFRWFMENVNPDRSLQDMSQVGLIGAIQSANPASSRFCVDTMQEKNPGKPYSKYSCHGQLGAQGWFEEKDTGMIRNMASENLCLGRSRKLAGCNKNRQEDAGWKSIPERRWLGFRKPDRPIDSTNWEEDYDCFASSSQEDLFFKPCVDGDPEILWNYQNFKYDPNYKGLSWDNIHDDPFEGMELYTGK